MQYNTKYGLILFPYYSYLLVYYIFRLVLKIAFVKQVKPAVEIDRNVAIDLQFVAKKYVISFQEDKQL